MLYFVRGWIATAVLGERLTIMPRVNGSIEANSTAAVQLSND
ncbi:MAG: hypothetical protein OFPI_26990 [Osedax symbiont Rs2]|nr:MAG: hypothetical protein OFPI_26990 [Osedax symbiont Rs2]